MIDKQCDDCARPNCICLECKQLLYVDECYVKTCPYEVTMCPHFDGSEVFKGVF